MKKIILLIIMLFLSRNIAVSADSSVLEDANKKLSVSVVSTVDASEKIDYKSYTDKFAKKIFDNWIFADATDDSSLVIMLEIDKDGRLNVRDLSRKKQSENSRFDLIVKKTISAVKVYKEPFPKNYNKDEILLKLVFSGKSSSKNLNVIGKTDFSGYMVNLQKKIYSRWESIKGGYNESKRTILIFQIRKDGSLKSCSVYQSSGDKDFDNLAVKAVKDSAPFAPLPQSFSGKFINVRFSFDYEIAGYKSSNGVGKF